MAEGSIDTTTLGIIAVVVCPIAAWFVILGRRRLEQSAARAIFWWVGTAMGLGFLALISIAAGMEEPDFGRFDLGLHRLILVQPRTDLGLRRYGRGRNESYRQGTQRQRRQPMPPRLTARALHGGLIRNLAVAS